MVSVISSLAIVALTAEVYRAWMACNVRENCRADDVALRWVLHLNRVLLGALGTVPSSITGEAAQRTLVVVVVPISPAVGACAVEINRTWRRETLIGRRDDTTLDTAFLGLRLQSTRTAWRAVPFSIPVALHGSHLVLSIPDTLAIIAHTVKVNVALVLDFGHVADDMRAVDVAVLRLHLHDRRGTRTRRAPRSLF